MQHLRPTLLLLLAAFLASQVYAAQHVHVEEPSSECLVCAQIDGDTQVASTSELPERPVADSVLSATYHDVAPQKIIAGFQPRGPPLL